MPCIKLRSSCVHCLPKILFAKVLFCSDSMFLWIKQPNRVSFCLWWNRSLSERDYSEIERNEKEHKSLLQLQQQKTYNLKNVTRCYIHANTNIYARNNIHISSIIMSNPNGKNKSSQTHIFLFFFCEGFSWLLIKQQSKVLATGCKDRNEKRLLVIEQSSFKLC